ncbi:MAG: aminomethyl-transferring glycine dehydrogenase subunit GcvPB [Solirubrobacterales bacterium]|nr:aminomethyl-transferring glycine dehydrogenase subunit GcvPB [Solirubrobacterales bacterium]MBV9166439.1 aminomethyl-transferring glycine dehydrogenase subunit GcvPB [Solirubrobacterales bacterium]MBV9535244.1 aminomethyl-transferring glycine dehydrogenase subunit GcvPB [Solirubrobacterales bacterium]
MTLRQFHQASWNEPILLELSNPGERGIVPPQIEQDLAAQDGLGDLPAALRRSEAPRLPELSQPQLLRHYLRLSQETLGNDVNIHLGLGTCTMKYSPKVNEEFVRSPKVADLHPLQDEETVQGMLEVFFRLEQMLREISGMDRFTFQPAGGSQGVYANARMMRAYHAARGEDHRDEIVTTIFSHPCDGAGPATVGYKVVTVYAGDKGYPEPDAIRKAVSERTAGLMITNPEDTGLFNPHIDEIVEIIHEAGGLCHYDQANANGILGITRARDVGFDLCQFNLHKTFSSPHCSMGMPVGACGVTSELERFLPVPTVEFDGTRYRLDYERPQSVGKIRAFHGVPATVVRSFAWVMSLGAEGLREVAEAAVLNNNYLASRLAGVRGLAVSFADTNPAHRLEQIRYSLAQLQEETGVGTLDVARRTSDFGVASYFPSHEPWIVPEPMTLEPSDSYSRADLDQYSEIIAEISREAYEEPQTVLDSPQRSTVHRMDQAPHDDPERWALTWRAYLRKQGGSAASEATALEAQTSGP